MNNDDNEAASPAARPYYGALGSVDVTVWVCPTPGCGNYFGSSSSPDLAQARIHPSVDNKHEWQKAHPDEEYKFTRDECPNCRQLGKKVARRPVLATLLIPMLSPDEKPLQAATEQLMTQVD